MVNFMLLVYVPVCVTTPVSLDSQASPPDYNLHNYQRQNWKQSNHQTDFYGSVIFQYFIKMFY